MVIIVIAISIYLSECNVLLVLNFFIQCIWKY